MSFLPPPTISDQTQREFTDPNPVPTLFDSDELDFFFRDYPEAAQKLVNSTDIPAGQHFIEKAYTRCSYEHPTEVATLPDGCELYKTDYRCFRVTLLQWVIAPENPIVRQTEKLLSEEIRYVRNCPQGLPSVIDINADGTRFWLPPLRYVDDVLQAYHSKEQANIKVTERIFYKLELPIQVTGPCEETVTYVRVLEIIEEDETTGRVITFPPRPLIGEQPIRRVLSIPDCPHAAGTLPKNGSPQHE